MKGVGASDSDSIEADAGPRQPLPVDLLGGPSEDGSLDDMVLGTVTQGDHRPRVFDGTRARGSVAQGVDVEPSRGGGNRPGTGT